jgi:type IV pilus assembly protein PilY1
LAGVNPSSRQIISNDGSLGVSFDWATLSGRANYLAALTAGTSSLTATDAQKMVDYMRGDRSNEGPTGFRERPKSPDNIMGPVVSAAPWIQDRPIARFTDSQQPGYSGYVSAQASRTKVLWAASDDGMVHGFVADTGAPLFSYAPGALAQRFNELVRQGAGVQAFVDGSPFSADVWIDKSSTNPSDDWRTYLFGTLGRGGRAVYALDTTNVSSLTATNAASIFKWEFTADTDNDLGYIVSDIAVEPGTGQAAPVAKLNNGKFALIMGNGLKSATGSASLFILPVEGPDSSGSWAGRYKKIVADPGGSNGLSTPTWVDLDNNGTADVVYAGDLKGNLWKFDISDTNPANWKVAYMSGGVPAPLYIAADGTNVLPITAAPQFSFPSFGGTMVTFATGMSNTAADYPRYGVTQKTFGIWDRPEFSTPPLRSLPRGSSTLESRTYVRQSTGEVVVTAGNTIDFQNTNPTLAKDGWYFDLPGASEMVVSNLEFRLNNIVMTSIRPKTTTDLSCGDLPLATLYLFDPVSGSPNTSALGTITVGTVTYQVVGRPVSDQKLRVVNDRTDLPNSTTCIAGQPGCVCVGATCSKPAICPDGSAPLRAIGGKTDQEMCFNQSNARIQWREVPGLRTR